MSRYRSWFFAFALLTLFFDQATKFLVRLWLPLGKSVPILPNFFYLTHTQNPGAAFGLFPNATALLIVVALFVSAIFLWLGHQGFDKKRIAIAAGMMLGGALGNLIDRVRFGAVTDFIDIGIWPIFNIADIALTVGAFLLLCFSLTVSDRRSGSKVKSNDYKSADEIESTSQEKGLKFQGDADFTVNKT